MTVNLNLHMAKKHKDDEFYTQFSEVANEMSHYTNSFHNKTILCNCNNPNFSAFWQYFHLNFANLGLKKLISTYYSDSCPVFKSEYTGGFDSDITVCSMHKLNGDGDFRSQECIDILNEADIVITNPPFSLFREYVSILIQYHKQFCIIGTLNAVKYKEIFPLFQSNMIWLGANNGDMAFMVPFDSEERATRYWVDESGQKWRSLGNVVWLTNMDLSKRHTDIILTKHYSELHYPKYDNYDAIDVSKVVDIPMDYDFTMGVPITFFTKYNPNQFRIVGKLSNGMIHGKKVYERILIRKI